MTTQVVKRYHIELDRFVTNGHDFCELIVDETNGRFTAILYGGECYTFCFAHGNTPFMAFLARIFDDCKKDDYLYWKLRDYRLDNLIDTEKTAEAIGAYIEKECDTSDADMASIQETLEDFAAEGSLMEEALAELWSDRFAELIEAELLPTWWGLFDWGIYDEVIHKTGDARCRIFCELIAPILGAVLTQEMQPN